MFLLSHCALLAFVFFYSFFFFNDTATTEIYTLSLHDALPISVGGGLHDSLHDLGGGERHLLHGEPRLAPLLPAHDEHVLRRVDPHPALGVTARHHRRAPLPTFSLDGAEEVDGLDLGGRPLSPHPPPQAFPP